MVLETKWPVSLDCSVDVAVMFPEIKLLLATFSEHWRSSRIPKISLSWVLKQISSEKVFLWQQLRFVAMSEEELSAQILDGDQNVWEELFSSVSNKFV